VATEYHLDREQFLAALCDKAMLPRDAWRHPDTRLLAFTAQVIGGRMLDLLEPPADPGPRPCR
jgi:AMMECR1 domain-containing protein